MPLGHLLITGVPGFLGKQFLGVSLPPTLHLPLVGLWKPKLRGESRKGLTRLMDSDVAGAIWAPGHGHCPQMSGQTVWTALICADAEGLPWQLDKGGCPRLSPSGKLVTAGASPAVCLLGRGRRVGIVAFPGMSWFCPLPYLFPVLMFPKEYAVILSAGWFHLRSGHCFLIGS